MSDAGHSGRCLCGAVRYEVEGDLRDEIGDDLPRAEGSSSGRFLAG